MLEETFDSLKLEATMLNLQLVEMEEIYGDHFPEPSEQLDRWNKIYDRLQLVEDKIKKMEAEKS